MDSLREKLSAYARLEAWVFEPEPSTFAPDSRRSNRDMDPVPLKQVGTPTTIFCELESRHLTNVH